MTFWQQIAAFCGVLGIWSALILACLKWMLDSLATSVTGFRNDVHALELELERTKSRMAERYLSRDDFAVFATGIEARLDRLGRKFDAIAR